jgi:hypothetical protein
MDINKQTAYTPRSDRDILKANGHEKFSVYFGSACLAAGILAIIQIVFTPVSDFFIGPWGCGLFSLLTIIFGIERIADVNSVTVNRKKMEMIHREGRFKKPTVISLKAASEITLSLEQCVIGGGEFNDVSIMYPVKIYTGQAYLFYETTHYETARKYAKQIARFLDLPMVDLTRGPKVARKHPDEFDLSVIDQLKNKEKITVPGPPEKLKSTIHHVDRGVLFHIPPRGITSVVRSQLLSLSVIILISMAMILLYDHAHNIPVTDRYIIYAIGAICFVGFPVLIAIRIVRIACIIPHRIHVGSFGIVFEKQGFLKKEKLFIEANILQELKTYLPSKRLKSTYHDNINKKINYTSYDSTKQPPARIVAISDDVTMEFGHGLLIQELEYITALSLKALISFKPDGQA